MKSAYKRLGDYIKEVNIRNSNLTITNLLGVNIDKFFMPSVANVVGTDMSVYKIVKKGQFACNRMHVGRDYRLPVALSDSEEDFLVSPAYDVFEITDAEALSPEYLMMWFSRKEFDRNAWFYTDADVRGGLHWKAFCDMQLPIPDIDTQREIVKEYHTLVNRIKLNQQLNKKLEQTAQALYKQWFVDFEFPNENGKPYKSNGGDMIWCEELGIRIPDGWEIKSLAEVSSYINRGIAPVYVESDGIAIINQKCIRNNTIDLSFSRLHSKEFRKIPDDKYLKKYDILVNSTGEGTLGRVGLMKVESKPITVDTHVTIVRASIVDPLFLWFHLSSRTFDIENLGEGSTGQTELSRENLAQLRITFPKKNTQKIFSLLTETLIDKSFLIDCELPLLNELRSTLLSKMSKPELLETSQPA